MKVSPVEFYSFLGEVEERSSNIREVFDELSAPGPVLGFRRPRQD